MDARFSLGLISALALAVVVGVVAARSQAQPAVARAPTATPTPLPTPLPFDVNIAVNPGGNPAAVYDPTTLTVPSGHKVTWVNLTGTDQSVVLDDGSFSSGVLSPGQAASWLPRKPGAYPYGSFIDPNMRGEIIVTL